MNDIYTILNEIKPDIDYEREEKLIDNGLLDSFDIVMLIGSLEDTFGINVSALDIIPDNFNSANAIYDMVRRLKGE